MEEAERLKTELAECETDKKELERRALTPEKRDRILNALGVGKQSPQYKRAKAVLDQLM